MAEFEAIGKALQIPQSVINNIDAIDKKINQIASDSEKMATHFMSAMTRMGTGADGLLKKLQSMQTTINKLDISKFAQGVQNVGRGTTQVEQFAAAIAKAAAAINKYNAENRKRTDVDNSKQIAQLNKEIEAMRKRTQQLEEYINKQRQVNQGGGRRGGGSSSSGTNSDTKALNAYNRAMAASEALVTQRINKIAKLRNAAEQLRNAQGNYAIQLSRINQEIARLNRLNEGQVDAYGRVIRSQRQLMNTSQQLTRQLALLFSVSQIESYIQKMVRVRGEFELQNTALASILDSKDRADRLFAQVTELAVQSPYTIKELTTYTKSLSAYQVEYEKLYDTLKMLADVSSGLGVDMQRLILAFGQVKAANFLRGTETRQFTEAGINMLGELAKYYSELEGRIVSVSEVQDRQFKRMISFQDVAEVFKRLTSEGGMFYNMQERQAETLAGMMSNLQDRIDLMLNKVGTDYQDVIKNVIELLQDLISNYDVFVRMIYAGGAAFVAYKAYILSTSRALISYATSLKLVTAGSTKMLSVTQLLAVGLSRLTKNIKATSKALMSFVAKNPYLIAIAAIGTAVYEAIHWNDEYNETIDELNKKTAEQAANLIKVAEAYDELSAKAKQAIKEQNFGQVSEYYKGQFGQLEELNRLLKEQGLELPVRLSLVTPENIDSVFNQGKTLLDEANKFGQELNEALTASMTEAEGKGPLGLINWFGDNLKTDLEQLSEAYTQIGAGFERQMEIVENEIIIVGNQLTGKARDYYAELRKGRSENETDTEWLIRKYNLMSGIWYLTSQQNRALADQINKNNIILNASRSIVDITRAETEVQKELNGVVDTLVKNFGGIEQLKEYAKNNPIMIRTLIDRAFEKTELSAQAKRFASFWLQQQLEIPVVFRVQDENKAPEFYNDFRDTVRELDKAGVFESSLASMTDYEKLSSAIQTAWSHHENTMKVANQLSTKNLDLQEQINEARQKALGGDLHEMERLNNLQKQKQVNEELIKDYKERARLEGESIKNVAKAFNLSLSERKANGGGSKKNPYLEQLKEQLQLIKDVYEAYKKYRQYMSEEEASSMAKELASGTGYDGYVASLSLDTQGLIEALDSLLSNVGKKVGKEGRDEIEDLKRDLKEEFVIRVKTEGLEEVQRRVDNIFRDYEFSLELKNAGFSEDSFKNLLRSIGASESEIASIGLNTTNFKDVQNSLRAEADKLIEQGGEKQIEAATKIQEHLTKLEVDEAKKRQDELAQLREKYLTNEQKISNIKVDISGWEDELEKLNNAAEDYTSEQRELLEYRIKAGHDEILRLESEAVELTDFWRTLFGDLSELSVRSLMRIMDQRKEILDNATPIYDDEGQTKGYSSYYTDENGTIKQLTLTKNQFNQLTKAYKNLNDEFKNKNPLTAFVKSLDLGKEETESWADYLTRLSGNFDALSEHVFSVADAMANAFGASDSTMTELNASKDIVNGISGAFKGALSGDIFSVAQGIASIASGIRAIHDNKREEQIQREIEKVDNLEKAYENLYDTIQNGLTIKMFSDNAALISNIQKQIRSYQSMIAAERDKKDSDEERIEEWENSIASLYDQIGELYRNIREEIVGSYKSLADELGGALVSAFQNGENAAQAWGDTVNDAILEIVKNILVMRVIEPQVQAILDDLFAKILPKTDAAEEAYNEIGRLQNELSKINAGEVRFSSISERLNAVGDLKRQIADMQAQYEILNDLATGELPDITQDMVDSTVDALSVLPESLRPYTEIIQSLVDKANTDNLSGLQKGIQSVTEETAQALEALLESLRFYVSDQNQYIQNIYDWLTNRISASPLVTQMNLQVRRLEMIYDLWNGIIRNSTGKGRVLKVEIV